MPKRYTDEFLISELCRFYEQFGKIPVETDFHYNSNYPSENTYRKHFNNWNSALEIAGFQTHKYTHLTDRPNICEICGSTKTFKWMDKNNLKVCGNCYTRDRKHLHGTLNPKSNIGIAVITEHVVYKVLGDCEKCNTSKTFNASYDLLSESLGTINVKSAKLRYSTGNRINWLFGKNKNSIIPNYYVCIGFNNNKSIIEHVWIIPGDSNLVTDRGISISLSNLERAVKYEVDAQPYNEVYQNLDIYSLSEFKDLNK